MNTLKLTKTIRKMLIDHDMTMRDLAKELDAHPSSLGNAINMIRTGPAEIKLLTSAYAMLKDKTSPPEFSSNIGSAYLG